MQAQGYSDSVYLSDRIPHTDDEHVRLSVFRTYLYVYLYLYIVLEYLEKWCFFSKWLFGILNKQLDNMLTFK